jgi:uncharacterized protein YyaL (SSP411 family)
VGKRDSAEIREWLERLGLVYAPNLALFVADTSAGAQSYLPEHVRDRAQVDGRATAYVCRERVCSTPLTSLKEIEAELAGG